MYSTTWIATAVRSVLYASALSAGVLLCAHAGDRDQLKSIQADIAARQRAIKQQQQRAACSPSSKRRKRRSPPPPQTA
jgi:septal ring factor EnvC (AmiA/AmiB activator)